MRSFLGWMVLAMALLVGCAHGKVNDQVQNLEQRVALLEAELAELRAQARPSDRQREGRVERPCRGQLVAQSQVESLQVEEGWADFDPNCVVPDEVIDEMEREKTDEIAARARAIKEKEQLFRAYLEREARDEAWAQEMEEAIHKATLEPPEGLNPAVWPEPESYTMEVICRTSMCMISITPVGEVKGHLDLLVMETSMLLGSGFGLQSPEGDLMLHVFARPGYRIPTDDELREALKD